MAETTLAISTRKLSCRYGDFIALHPLNLDIPKGEVFGFLGHNGAGKTTTIQLLTTLLEPSSGEASVAGCDARRNVVQLRRQIGYLPENVRLYDTLSTRENLRFFASLSQIEDAHERVEEVMDFLHIRELADRRLSTFSKGMRQRVGLAQAIVHRPSVLFLDEPTSGLDPMGVRMLREVIERLNADGMTIFMNTHVLSEVARSCTSIGVLSHGRLVFHDRIEAVSARYGDEAALEELYLSVVPGREDAA
ncbi:putative ABC transporter ATP-binding protein NosF [Pleomorphomonas sp. T1.2MG-36]|uniref:ABC transporter ATP-binding protein n=1 Tax=Pleomorphomonas sp. T1.2MG-36 TaxID=3041167 RepID=UPI0024779761|nr:ABC transporter ATP-binding protein [Pleomorphomonas sp. T1.2MG-36]CAI9418728.1 putative ABC transporter ATP-binding protein NosF [Pleomorphomonas sp. T1.2MG-36]